MLQAYSKVGLGWLMAVLRFPLFRWLIDGAYSVVSRHRYTISKWLPGGAALASAVTQLKDVESAAMGYVHARVTLTQTRPRSLLSSLPVPPAPTADPFVPVFGWLCTTLLIGSADCHALVSGWGVRMRRSACSTTMMKRTSRKMASGVAIILPAGASISASH